MPTPRRQSPRPTTPFTEGRHNAEVGIIVEGDPRESCGCRETIETLSDGVGVRWAAVSKHHRPIGQHLAPIMARHERGPREGSRELTGEPGPGGQKPQASTTREGHHAGPITRYRQPHRPRSPLHLRSVFQFGDLETSQCQEFLTGQALPCIYTPTIPITRERSGLVSTSIVDGNDCRSLV